MDIPAKDIHRQTFDGGIDTVTAAEDMPANKAKYILNCNVLSTAAGNVGVITNIKGNTQVEFDLPDGDCICIGKAVDEERSNFYFAICNSGGFHTWYRYNIIEKRVSIVIQSKTDTGGTDILRWTTDRLILHANVIHNNRLYWTDTIARKINIDKALDKSVNGYGIVIEEDFINAYKRAPVYGPASEYFTDNTKPFNRMYGRLFRFAYRFYYDDGEKSNWSEFSNVPLPPKEAFTGINIIPANNNGIKLTVTTGSRIVIGIEIGMQSTDSELIDAVMQWVSIAYLDKKKLVISDDSAYIYNFYNDGAYAITDIEKILRPYSYLPKDPLCQAFLQNSLEYTNFHEGFPVVDIDMGAAVTYTPLFLDPGTSNQLNDPSFQNTGFEYVWVNVSGFGNGRRNSTNTMTIGFDVKAGNKFELFGKNGEGDNLYYSYTATLFDTAITVANQFKSQLRTNLKTRIQSISDNIIDGGGNVSFIIQLEGLWKQSPTKFTGNVNPVTFNSLKDTGQSVKNIKLGSSIKVGIEYEDFDGRKSLVYTADALIVKITDVNTLGGWKAPKIAITIKHQPPVWAKYYQIDRSRDLVYDSYLQMLIQKVINILATPGTTGEYLDLSIGSLIVYNKIHENSVLRYNFTKGDRIRLISKTSDGSFYPFFETEIIFYKEVTTQHFNQNLTISDTIPDQALIDGNTSQDNVGSFISFGGNEREIIGVVDGTHYQLDKPVAIVSGDPTQLFVDYDIINRNGVIRIKKPAATAVAVIESFSIIEIFRPALSGDASGAKLFYEFGKKFPIINAGTDTRAHAGNGQDQDGANPIATPAIVNITEGTAYVRNREMPTSNTFPGTQVLIATIEDPGYSDFYDSSLNDNGRVTAQDIGDGEVFFGSRTRYSNNFVEDTRINGLNDFDNLDRKDYNDQYGDVKLTKFDENKLYYFKTLKTGWVYVNRTIIQDQNGNSLLATTTKLLGDMNYFEWQGGIGDNPESYASNGNMKYFASANSGVICRIGGDGVTPLSEIYYLDNVTRGYLLAASKYGAKMFGEYDTKMGYILAIQAFKAFIFNDKFDSTKWIQYDSLVSNLSDFEIVVAPTHGTAIIGDNPYEFIYTPTADYVGSDFFTYRVRPPAGAWSDPQKVCITVVPEPSKLVGNEVITIAAVKNDCDPGYHGSSEDFVVDPNTVSAENQQDANNIAGNIADDSVQDNANLIGECILNDPEDFVFVDVTNQPLSTVVESNAITVDGPYPEYRISIAGAGAQYKINGGAWVNSTGLVNLGDIVKVRVTTSAIALTAKDATLTMGSVSDTYTATTGDNVPAAFSFTDLVDLMISTLTESDTITVSGITTPAPISIIGGEYQINGGSWVSSSGILVNGDTVTIRRTTSGSYGTAVNATLTIGGVSDIWYISTGTISPIPFSFTDQSGLSLSTIVVSNALTMAGFTLSSPISIVGGQYRINGGSWTSSAGTINSGDALELRGTTSGSNDTDVDVTVTVGGYSDTWTIRTLSASGLAWRGIDGECTDDGYFVYPTLEEYTVSTGIATGPTKTNDPDDDDYIAPVYDTDECPITGSNPIVGVRYDLGSIEGICDNMLHTVYVPKPATSIAPGVHVFTDAGLTTPLTGFDYLMSDFMSEIFLIDSATGIVGASTGTFCS